MRARNITVPLFAFDIYKDWATPHKTHRFGTDIDIRSKSILSSTVRRLKEIICDNGGYPYFEDNPPHYHLFFAPYFQSNINLCLGVSDEIN